MIEQRKRRAGTVVSIILLLILFSSAVFVVLNRQLILDTVHFWTFSAPESIKKIKNRTMLSDTGAFLFYATRPSVESNQTFNISCQRKEQNVAVIGCYVGNRIYIYDVTDGRLDGIKEVTAAHELLHAVYQRLSDAERTEVNMLIEAEYIKLANDPGLAERMAFYARTEPGERYNELFSIIGTEITTIDNRLEKYYSKYFSDRKRIVELFKGYNQAFSQLEYKTTRLSSQLDVLSKKIDDQMLRYNESVNKLNVDIKDFNQRAENGVFASVNLFNTERQTLQSRVSSLAQLRNTINEDVVEYEKIRIEYNDTVIQNRQLYRSIDSNLEPAPAVSNG